MKFVLIGAGNLATPVALALHSAGHEFLQVWSRHAANAASLAQQLGAQVLTDLRDVCPDADFYLYAIRDAYLQEVVDAVANQLNSSPKQGGAGGVHAIHAHTAGSMGLSVFQGRQPHAAVFYPYQSFSKQRMPNFHSVPIFLETALKADFPTLEAVARSISPLVYAANSEQRRRIHLAGVFANNFSNAMYRICEEQIRSAGIPFSTMLGLIDETAAKVHLMSPAEAQTGPAQRGDRNVMREHLQLLPPAEQAIYQAISDYIIQNHGIS